jgi:hypothetical protein
MERYSAFADDLDTVVCFLLFQDTSDFPRKVQYPVTDRRVIGHLAQSASQYPIKWSGLSEGNNNPCPGAAFK